MTGGSNSTPGVTIRNLAARRGDRLVFEGLDVTAAAGQAIMVTGPNGSGKSTLLRILVGLLMPHSGTVEIGPERPGATCFAGHLDGLKAALSVDENLRFWGGIYGAAPAAVEQAIRRLDLMSVADMPANMLSAGWRRRAGLARLLISDAPVWVLDEPFTALDTENIQRLDSVLDDHVGGGGIAILASHQKTGFTAPLAIDMRDYVPARPLIEDLGW